MSIMEPFFFFFYISQLIPLWFCVDSLLEAGVGGGKGVKADDAAVNPDRFATITRFTQTQMVHSCK